MPFKIDDRGFVGGCLDAYLSGWMGCFGRVDGDGVNDRKKKICKHAQTRTHTDIYIYIYKQRERERERVGALETNR